MTPIGTGKLHRTGPETFEGQINLAGFDYQLKAAVVVGPERRALELKAFYEPLPKHLRVPLIDGEAADG